MFFLNRLFGRFSGTRELVDCHLGFSEFGLQSFDFARRPITTIELEKARPAPRTTRRNRGDQIAPLVIGGKRAFGVSAKCVGVMADRAGHTE